MKLQYLSMKQVQAKLSVSRDTLYRWRKRKELKFPKPVTIAGMEDLRWIESEVDEWAIANQKRAAA